MALAGHRAAPVLAALALLATGCNSDQSARSSDVTATSAPTTSAPFTAPPVDWNNRSNVDISLPSGWRLTACEGDAPFLCASTSDGTVDGTVALTEYPSSGDRVSRETVEADAEELYRITEEDRQATCGPEFHLEPDPLAELTVGGRPGYRFGYQLRGASDEVTEHVVLHVVDDGARRIVINTAFSDADACPGEDPERNEFPIEAFTAIDPYLDAIVATSVLPLDTRP